MKSVVESVSSRFCHQFRTSTTVRFLCSEGMFLKKSARGRTFSAVGGMATKEDLSALGWRRRRACGHWGWR